MPLRWYHGTFTLERQAAAAPGRPRPAAAVGAAGPGLPYPPGQVRSVTLSMRRAAVGRCHRRVPVACHPAGQEPDPARVAGVDLGIIHPYAVAGPGGDGLLVSGRAMRAEYRITWHDGKARRRAVARRAPRAGAAGSRRWPHFRRRQRLAEARHRRRVRQAQHEAARAVIAWAWPAGSVPGRSATRAACSNLTAGRRHNQRTRDWRIGHLITVLADGAEAAGIGLILVDSGAPPPPAPTASTGVPTPAGPALTGPACSLTRPPRPRRAANIRPTRAAAPSSARPPTATRNRRADAHSPDVVLMDLERRGSTITATRRLPRPLPQSPLRARPRQRSSQRCSPGQIAEAIRRDAAGDPILSKITRRLMDRAAAEAGAQERARLALRALSPREREVVLAIARGRTNAEIAAELYMSVPTVKAHITHILTKLQLGNRTQIALLAHDADLA